MLADADGYDRACDGREATAALDADLVRQIQSALAARGYEPGPADVVMGSGTRSAIAAWQDAEGFPATGEPTDDEVAVLLAGAVPDSGLAVSLAPKCEEAAEGAECWKEIANMPDCHIWDFYYWPDQTVIWSGSCSGGIADGRGELVIPKDGRSVEQTGTLSGGRREGPWRVRFPDGTVAEGAYVAGRQHERWTVSTADGFVSEFNFVDGGLRPEE